MNETHQPWQIETPETLQLMGLILRQLPEESAFIIEVDGHDMHINVVDETTLSVDFIDHGGNQQKPRGKVEVKTYSRRVKERVVVFSVENRQLVIRSQVQDQQDHL